MKKKAEERLWRALRRSIQEAPLSARLKYQLLEWVRANLGVRVVAELPMLCFRQVVVLSSAAVHFAEHRALKKNIPMNDVYAGFDRIPWMGAMEAMLVHAGVRPDVAEEMTEGMADEKTAQVR